MTRLQSPSIPGNKGGLGLLAFKVLDEREEGVSE